MESITLSFYLFLHDFSGKPVSTFPDRALVAAVRKGTDEMWRAIGVGVIIAGLGPILGFAAVISWVLVDRSFNTALYLLQFPGIVTTPYLLGGGPGAVAGLVAAWRMGQCGTISVCFWSAATAIFALAPSLLYLALSAPLPNGIAYVTDREIAVAYIGAVTFSSIVLRFLLSVSGLLLRSSQG